MKFADRTDAGRKLAHLLRSYKHSPVVAIARGGVIVGSEIAHVLDSPLMVKVIRKLGVPDEPELAFGAVAADGTFYLDRLFMLAKGIHEHDMRRIAVQELRVAREREALYDPYTSDINLKSKTIVLVDDGLATGATVHVTLHSLRKKKPERIIAAFPVCAGATVGDILDSQTSVICFTKEADFTSVGSYYTSFPQVTDEEVVETLKETMQATK